jgi:hypothetical protein
VSDKTLPQAFEFQPTPEVNPIGVRIHEVFPQLMRLTTQEWHLHPGEHGDQELRRIVVRLGSTFACYTPLRSVVSIHQGEALLKFEFVNADTRKRTRSQISFSAFMPAGALGASSLQLTQ